MAKKTPEVRTVTVLSPIKHDGNLYQVGEEIELSAKDAAALRAVGAASDPKADAEEAAAAAAKADAEALQNAE